MKDTSPTPKSQPSSATRRGYLSEAELAELDRKTALCVENMRKRDPNTKFGSDLRKELASKNPA
jgi:hypothetical protein